MEFEEFETPYNEGSQLETVEEKSSDQEVKKEETVQSIKGLFAEQKIIAFSDPPPAAVEYSQQSIIPAVVMKHYKQFGLKEQIIKTLFHAQPSGVSSHKPVIASSFKASPKSCG